MMTEGLKPCPFCGEEAFTGETLDQTGENRYVACHKSTCAFLGYFTAEAEAVEAWNTRPDPRDEVIAELVEVARMVVEASDLAGFSGPLGDAARAALTKHKGTNP